MLPDSKVSFTTAEAVPLATAMVAYEARVAGIKCLIIKGPAAVKAGLRDRRPSADVDVLVEPSRFSEYLAIFEAKGWQRRYDYPTHPTIVDPHSVTLIHPDWPCDLDVHSAWPGFFVKPKVAFDLLWQDHETAKMAGQKIDVPAWPHHALIMTLHSLRTPSSAGPARDYEIVLGALRHKATLPGYLDGFCDSVIELGATETAGPLLNALGKGDLVPTTRSKAYIAWELQAKSALLKGVGWNLRLRAVPVLKRPAVMWKAVFPPVESLATTFPQLVGSPLWLLRAWARRLVRGVGDLQEVNQAIDRVTHEN
ncbi:MAG: hypothetical protein RL670_1206 [Actinomycetota bacterium]